MFESFFFASITSFLGLFIGMVLAIIAPEELKIGQKYFIWFYRILAFVLGFFLLKKSYYVSATIAVVFLVSFKLDNKIFYNLLPATLFVSAYMGTFNIIVGIVFLFGLVYGTQYCIQFEADEELTKDWKFLTKNLFKRHYLFLILCLLFLI